jgi:hypothetical protein
VHKNEKKKQELSLMKYGKQFLKKKNLPEYVLNLIKKDYVYL